MTAGREQRSTRCPVRGPEWRTHCGGLRSFDRPMLLAALLWMGSVSLAEAGINAWTILNERGTRFRRIQGRSFATIGRDTYKSMDASLGDIDRNGWLDIYVSYVHVPLQAEGSLLWMTCPDPRNPRVPEFRDEATRRDALNERRFGWGAALGGPEPYTSTALPMTFLSRTRVSASAARASGSR